jgi:hypothetical protein
VQQRVAGQPPVTPGGASEQALVSKASAWRRRSQHPRRRQQGHQVISDNDKSFIDSLIFWQDKPPSGTIIDPTKEQQRIRDAQASGQPSTRRRRPSSGASAACSKAS